MSALHVPDSEQLWMLFGNKVSCELSRFNPNNSQQSVYTVSVFQGCLLCVMNEPPNTHKPNTLRLEWAHCFIECDVYAACNFLMCCQSRASDVRKHPTLLYLELIAGR